MAGEEPEDERPEGVALGHEEPEVDEPEDQGQDLEQRSSYWPLADCFGSTPPCSLKIVSKCRRRQERVFRSKIKRSALRKLMSRCVQLIYDDRSIVLTEARGLPWCRFLSSKMGEVRRRRGVVTSSRRKSKPARIGKSKEKRLYVFGGNVDLEGALC